MCTWCSTGRCWHRPTPSSFGFTQQISTFLSRLTTVWTKLLTFSSKQSAKSPTTTSILIHARSNSQTSQCKRQSFLRFTLLTTWLRTSRQTWKRYSCCCPWPGRSSLICQSSLMMTRNKPSLNRCLTLDLWARYLAKSWFQSIQTRTKLETRLWFNN